MSASVAQAAHGGVASLNLFSCKAERKRESMKYWVKEYLQQIVKAMLDSENDSRIVKLLVEIAELSYIDFLHVDH